jgi:hypothetical protein
VIRRHPARFFLGLALASAVVLTSLVIAMAAGGGTALTPKQQYEAQLQQTYVQDQQGIRAPKSLAAPPSFQPCSLTIAAAGIQASHVGPESAMDFAVSNSWSGTISSVWYAAYAGATVTPSQGVGEAAVDVTIRTRTSDGCGVNVSSVGTYTDSGVTGPLTITSVSGQSMYLDSATNQHVVFDLLAHTFTG